MSDIKLPLPTTISYRQLITELKKMSLSDIVSKGQRLEYVIQNLCYSGLIMYASALKKEQVYFKFTVTIENTNSLYVFDQFFTNHHKFELTLREFKDTIMNGSRSYANKISTEINDYISKHVGGIHMNLPKSYKLTIEPSVLVPIYHPYIDNQDCIHNSSCYVDETEKEKSLSVYYAYKYEQEYSEDDLDKKIYLVEPYFTTEQLIVERKDFNKFLSAISENEKVNQNNKTPKNDDNIDFDLNYRGEKTYLNPNHKFYAEELHIAIQAWEAIYIDGYSNKDIGITTRVKKWLSNTYPTIYGELISRDGVQITEKNSNSSNRIATIVNATSNKKIKLIPTPC